PAAALPAGGGAGRAGAGGAGRPQGADAPAAAGRWLDPASRSSGARRQDLSRTLGRSKGRRMSAGRDAILGGIRKALGRAALAEHSAAELDRRLARHPRGIIPARVQLQTAELVALFEEKARVVNATVA